MHHSHFMTDDIVNGPGFWWRLQSREDESRGVTEEGQR